MRKAEKPGLDGSVDLNKSSNSLLLCQQIFLDLSHHYHHHNHSFQLFVDAGHDKSFSLSFSFFSTFKTKEHTNNMVYSNEDGFFPNRLHHAGIFREYSMTFSPSIGAGVAIIFDVHTRRFRAHNTYIKKNGPSTTKSHLGLNI